MNQLFVPILLLLLASGCDSGKTSRIRFSSLEKFSGEKKRIEITLLKSFLSEGKCDPDRGKYYADAFLCKIDQTNDTILVFTICQAAYPFLKSNYTGPKGLAIDNTKIESKYPDEVFITIDKTTLTKHYPYFIGKIGNYIED